ncbi:hypothetical protein [Anditalea andensis]|uniref:Uncharacterized protein n=1 Tax=Anditalea andensis TaxID=1048983 RepID=A0A074L1G3_9BACT|nr:hypothetical protein [Anditalea andensis]KEO73678.1 hypothetical protein EL17_11095 [Anditalea andensis]
MQKRINRFLRGMVCLITGRPKGRESDDHFRVSDKAEAGSASTNALSQQQCLALIDSVGLILKEEAAKRGMHVQIHVGPGPEKPPSTDMVQRENGSP